MGGMLAVDVETAIDTELATESRLATRIRAEMAEPNLPKIPAYLIVQVLEKSLSSKRAALHGWCVFNFPSEHGDSLVTDFARSQFTPNRVVLFKQDLDTSQERLSYRLTDPLTGEVYHQLFNPPHLGAPPTVAIKMRSVVRDSDQTENVTDRYNHHSALIADYESLIGDFGGFSVNSNQPIENVFETIESKLDKPLPTVYH